MLSGTLQPLITRGRFIVDSSTGLPLRLRGVNRSGLEYTRDGIVTAVELDAIASWGASVVRLPFNQAWALDGGAYLDALDGAIELAASRGIYTLLDLHWLDADSPRGRSHDGRANFVPPLPDERSAVVWKKIAARFRGEPAVLFDLFNEPHDPLPDDEFWQEPRRRVTSRHWHTWAYRLIDAIRSSHPEALIFVSGLDWGYDLSSFPLAGTEGIVYSTHVYPWKRKSWDRAFGTFSQSYPVFAGEWGGNADHLEWGERLLAYFDARDIGWAAWSWCDEPRLVGPSFEPTAFGSLVRLGLNSLPKSTPSPIQSSLL